MSYPWKAVIVGVAAAAWLLCCTQDTTQSPSAGAQGEADIASIHAFFEQYDRIFRTGAGEGFMSLMSNNVILMAPDRPAMVGKDAVWEGVRFLFENLDMDHAVTVDEVRVSDDWAYVRATYHFRGTPKTGGRTTEHLGKAAYLLERQPDKSWRIARDCYNTDHPTDY